MTSASTEGSTARPTDRQAEHKREDQDFKLPCLQKTSPELFLLLLRENVGPNAVQLEELSQVGFVGVQLVLDLLHPLLQAARLPSGHRAAVHNHWLVGANTQKMTGSHHTKAAVG